MKKSFLRKLLLVAGSVFVTLVIVELCLRITGFSDPTLLYISDRDRGIALRPMAEGWWRNEGAAYIRINGDGLRDREHARAKPAGTLRIAVLGDSYAEALQVPLEDTFWSEIERRLQTCQNTNGRRVEVLNFGVSGYGTAQELITLRQHVWDYSPDIVLLAFTTGNDLNDNLAQLSNDTLRPYFVYRDDKLMLDMSTLNPRNASLRFRLRESSAGNVFVWFRDHLRVVQLLNVGLRAITTSGESNNDRSLKGGDHQSGENAVPANRAGGSRLGAFESAEPGLEDRVYYEPTDEVWKEAWRVTEGLISEMHDEVKNHGARFAVVTLSSSIQVSPNADEYEQTLRASGLKDLFYPERRIAAFGQRRAFPVLNLAPLLKAYAEQHRIYLHGFDSQLGRGHWNRSGHLAAGEMIGDWLCLSSVP